MDESSFYWGDNGVPVTDDQLIIEVSIYCESIFGFGITAKRDKGANFYHRSWELGEGLGMVCYGGQRDTVLISLSGEGCGAAKPGWENRLYQFLEHQAKRPRITRVDLAHDDFNGSRYSCDKAVADFDAGLFNAGGRTPDIEQRGNWKTHNGKGRTV
ncbi:MAG: replication initiation factor domain-containing protein, partial [Rhodocyclaceae bacterium]|nr:replication initiation factor domain-containing protein [Rhodocyclaceae bacterium]